MYRNIAIEVVNHYEPLFDTIVCTTFIEQQDIPCDMVRLSNCFYSGYCRVNNPMRGCDNQQRRQRVSWLLMPCAGGKQPLLYACVLIRKIWVIK